MSLVTAKEGGITIGLRRLLLEEQIRLERLAAKARYELADVPEGSLRLGKSQGCVQYYHSKEGFPHNGKYISKNEMELVRALAQKAYNEKILRYSEKTAEQIKRLLKNYEEEKIEKIYTSEHPERQKLIIPIEPTYEEKVEKWMAEAFVGKGFREEAPVILTNKGIRVRSKSEKIMADYFESLGLAYKYECPLRLEPYGIVYPDFAFLSRKQGRVVLWEHEGMMDNPEYARAAVAKIQMYEKNGFYQGENLILTFESSKTTINTELLKRTVERYLL